MRKMWEWKEKTRKMRLEFDGREVVLSSTKRKKFQGKTYQRSVFSLSRFFSRHFHLYFPIAIQRELIQEILPSVELGSLDAEKQQRYLFYKYFCSSHMPHIKAETSIARTSWGHTYQYEVWTDDAGIHFRLFPRTKQRSRAKKRPGFASWQWGELFFYGPPVGGLPLSFRKQLHDGFLASVQKCEPLKKSLFVLFDYQLIPLIESEDDTSWPNTYKIEDGWFSCQYLHREGGVQICSLENLWHDREAFCSHKKRNLIIFEKSIVGQ